LRIVKHIFTLHFLANNIRTCFLSAQNKLDKLYVTTDKDKKYLDTLSSFLSSLLL